MPFSRTDREFRLGKISYLEFKQIEMDRVLTGFFARLAHNGYPGRVRRNTELTVEEFVDEFLDAENAQSFVGFHDHRGILERWVETHLMDVVNRGKASQAIAGPRPLHGHTWRFRNAKYSRDYGAAQHLYEMLAGARQGAGQKALEHLHFFFFQGHDRSTGKADRSIVLDVETQALLHLSKQVGDTADTRAGRQAYPPLCVGAADLLAEDVMRLLFYQEFIPRSVMVDYLKVLFAFHMALYHLRLFKLLPALVRRQGNEPICGTCPMNPKSFDDPHGDCPYRIGLVVDVAGLPNLPMARLAEQSADIHYRRIPEFIQAAFATKKLDEFADYLTKRQKLTQPKGRDFNVGEVLALAGPMYKQEREKFFGQRVSRLLEGSNGSDEALDPEMKAVIDMGLPEYESYIEMIVAARGAFHRRYIVQTIDSLLLKNEPGALIAQGATRNAPRRFIVDSRLLEVLLQIAVLRPGGRLGYHTGEMRIDELLTFFQERYGLYVDRLPQGDGFGKPSIEDQKALRSNRLAFTDRLREIGFYRDLSDAYVTQTVTPRYRIDGNGVNARTVSETSRGDGS